MDKKFFPAIMTMQVLAADEDEAEKLLNRVRECVNSNFFHVDATGVELLDLEPHLVSETEPPGDPTCDSRSA